MRLLQLAIGSFETEPIFPPHLVSCRGRWNARKVVAARRLRAWAIDIDGRWCPPTTFTAARHPSRITVRTHIATGLTTGCTRYQAQLQVGMPYFIKDSRRSAQA